MSSSKQWLQTPANAADNGGAEIGATGFPAQEVVLEATVPGATEKQLGRSMVAGSPNEGMGPNVDRIDNGEGEGQAFSVPPRAGEKRPWDEAGGMDHVLEATVLRLMKRHGFQASSSSSSQRMASQEIQTELSGEVVLLEKSKSKITDEPSGGGGVDLISAMGSEDKASKGLSEVAEMHPEEILELEAVIQEEHEEEQKNRLNWSSYSWLRTLS